MLDAMPLLVAVRAAGEGRRAVITKLIEDAGHRVVAAEQCDVVVSDTTQASTRPPAVLDEAPASEVALSEGTSAPRPVIVLSDQTALAENHLPARATARQLDAALRAVTAGLSIRVAQSVPRRSFEEAADWAAQSLLTPREIDVIEAIGAGFSNKAIARELGISLHTVKFHIESLLRKLGARTRAEAVAKAMERRRKETVEL